MVANPYPRPSAGSMYSAATLRETLVITLDPSPRVALDADTRLAAVLEFPLARLEEVGEERMFQWEGATFPTQVYEVEGHVIWGATARILRTFFDALQGRQEA